jgi:hypothetical protein
VLARAPSRRWEDPSVWTQLLVARVDHSSRGPHPPQETVHAAWRRTPDIPTHTDRPTPWSKLLEPVVGGAGWVFEARREVYCVPCARS